ncbi:TKL family protein kinase [Histomonas meleagridis]|uniref:TKL family protein kinase n=1 Tax=Histomonas meleagridis TaxID=135588 RepID=UPI0035595909|nr:TKL family protein kinase [Histomonas meleagridis]KAH0807036.1 TKL family protein kinase [Histomonas meleagridis]
MRTFEPDASVNENTLREANQSFADVLNETMKIVYSCSKVQWLTTAITWDHTSVLKSVIQIRSQANKCSISFGCKNKNYFIISQSDLNDQDKIDIIALKSALMDYQSSISMQPQTPKLANSIQVLEQKIQAIGHLEGLDDGPGLSTIPPFLPEDSNSEISHSAYVLGDLIGNGTFGSVYTGTMVGTMKKVAVKELKMHTLRGRQLKTFKREVWVLSTVKHPSVLGLFGVTLTPPFCIVTELLKCSLTSRMSYLTPTRRSIIALKVAEGMNSLHMHGIIHRDLKSANILLDDDDQPRICDFGLVGFLTPEVHTGFVGTAQWMAPELLRSSPHYDEKVDVYSFAVLLWEMLLLKEQPYPGMSQDQVVMAVIQQKIRPQIPSNYGPPQLINLITKCWDEDPKERPSFTTICQCLMKPEFHFVGTNEDDFLNACPIQDIPQIQQTIQNDYTSFEENVKKLTSEDILKDDEALQKIEAYFPKLNFHNFFI